MRSPALLQAMVLIPLFGAAVYFICRDRFAEYFVLPLESVETGALQVGTSLAALLWRGAGVFLLFGIVDLVRQRTLRTEVRIADAPEHVAAAALAQDIPAASHALPSGVCPTAS